MRLSRSGTYSVSPAIHGGGHAAAARPRRRGCARSGPCRRPWRRTARARRPARPRRSRRCRRAAGGAGTWRPKVPALWWFLPCTSEATAPPSVTNAVPGVTGTNQPRGRKVRLTSRRREAGFGAQDAGLRIEADDAVGQARTGDDGAGGRRAARRRRSDRPSPRVRFAPAGDGGEILRQPFVSRHHGPAAPAAQHRCRSGPQVRVAPLIAGTGYPSGSRRHDGPRPGPQRPGQVTPTCAVRRRCSSQPIRAQGDTRAATENAVVDGGVVDEAPPSRRLAMRRTPPARRLG